MPFPCQSWGCRQHEPRCFQSPAPSAHSGRRIRRSRLRRLTWSAHRGNSCSVCQRAPLHLHAERMNTCNRSLWALSRAKISNARQFRRKCFVLWRKLCTFVYWYDFNLLFDSCLLALAKIQTTYYRTNFILWKKHEKHRGGASRQGARSPRKRLPAQYLIQLATANIVTYCPIRNAYWAYLNHRCDKKYFFIENNLIIICIYEIFFVTL